MQQRHFDSFHNKKIGAQGEEIAARYLENRGFTIIGRNYLKKCGEIDIVARETTGKVHFVEVKTVSYETKQRLEWAVSQRSWRPEENVHQRKLEKLQRVIDTWLFDFNHQGDWCIDVAAVRFVPREKYATVKFIPDVA